MGRPRFGEGLTLLGLALAVFLPLMAWKGAEMPNQLFVPLFVGAVMMAAIGVALMLTIKRPQLALGEELQLAALPDDPRPEMADWWHLRLENRRSRNPLVQTEEAKGCGATLEFLSACGQEKRANGCFLVPPPEPPQGQITLGVGEMTMIPVYLRARRIRHPIRGQSLPDGVYITGGEFLYHPRLLEGQLLPPDTYTIRITVMCTGQRIARELGPIDFDS
jgi:hypothetical protein